jgi:transposase-like protein
MPRGLPHPPEVRARVVAALEAGEGLSSVCKQYGVSKSSALHWKAENGVVQPDQRARTRERMADLIYDCLAEMLTTVRSQLQVTAREEWVAQQTAGELAQLVGVELDRAIRLLAGLRPAEDRDEQPALESGGAGTDHDERVAVPERAVR